MATNAFKLASDVFYQVCKLYNRWKVNNQIQEAISESRISEFGVDDYIRSKASYAESLMNLGEIKHAIEKFENAKKSIENEIVYENPMLFVNICNQLGNCYLTDGRLEKALDNFELSLGMIKKVEEERTSIEQPTNPLIVAKLCLNIALIKS